MSTCLQAETRESAAQTKCNQIGMLKSQMPVFERDALESEDLQRQVTSTERALETAGSAKTMQEVQDALGRLDKDM